ncbi:MAG TPA: PIG-L family deacetylase [Candidatus Omnitrophota bacterium]|nr:PIG-L family deacetylase [Candidatus Omnitrophota bacterium]HPD85481.1 PIG-L family deacetylase [Candidatus Omnitrophota bacterium]HRZ04018.1 PIG-L family deacetylase [Candidatus Omnitrophota bacterium]
MRRIRFVFWVCLFLALNVFNTPVSAQQAWPEVKLEASDRILILAPHPDDEVLGCGGIIQKAVALKLPVHIVFYTYGDNNQWSFLVYRKHPVLVPGAVKKMGLMRHDEALAASKALGVPAENLTFLGYPDFGTMSIWYAHWGNRPALRSMLTRVNKVPYAGALRPGAPYKGEEIVKDLTAVLRGFRPTKIFVSHPTDHNGDHLSLYLFTRVALWNLGEDFTPQIYPYLIHRAHWPHPKGYRPEEALVPPEPLKEEVSWFVSPLSPEEISRKEAALKAHRSQYRSSEKYLLSFVRANELFGDFPVIKLKKSETGESSLWPGAKEYSVQVPEELTDSERSAFVGLEWRFVRLEGDNLVLSIELSRPLAEGVVASIYAFGYRSDLPFGKMPKLHVKLGVTNHSIYDQNRRLPGDTIKVVRSAKEISISVPLAVLGDPQKILTSARTYLSEIPLGWVAWRVLELPGQEKPLPAKNPFWFWPR